VLLDVATIRIGDDVWLGGGVIICPGVSVGENTVVGAGRWWSGTCPPT
jgi:acetyltransferase-like isoleucine patch superfamily enzyme